MAATRREGVIVLTAADFAPLFRSPDFHDRLLQVVEQSLGLEPGAEYASFLRFPTGAEGHDVQIYSLASRHRGCFVRVGPTEASRRLEDTSVALYLERDTGRVRAIMSLDTLGPLRTSAPVLTLIKHAAPRGARVVAMIGAGEQARVHAVGLRSAIPSIEELRVFSRSSHTRERFAEEIRPSLAASVTVATSAEEASRSADVVCITAAGEAPAVHTSWLRPGALVTSILPFGLGVDSPVRMVAPSRERPLVRPSGWDPYPIEGPAKVAARADVTLQEIVRGVAPARTDASQIVAYVQLGPGPWDAALLEWAYDWAISAQVGSQVHFSRTDSE